MSLLDFSKNCDITTKSFSEDLLSYSLKDNQIIWENKITEGYTLKKDIFSFSDNKDTWIPVFYQDDNLVSNKIISHYGSVTGDSSFSSGRIGIENFIVFNPFFKNWDAPGELMVIDWILNRSRSEHSVEAGLMYWIRKTPKITGKIDFFPNYSKIQYNDKIYFKLDNETIRPIDPTKALQSSFMIDATVSFRYTEDDSDIKISDLIKENNNKDPEFILYGSEETKVWIPDGDQLLYFTNQSEKKQNSIQGIASRSYISGSLYKYYNIFYNSLTANEKLIKVTDTRSTHKLRQYKKLAHSLSTSPFSSEFFAILLAKPTESIKTAINNYLTKTINSISNDIIELKKVLEVISQEYSKYEINNNSNIINNNDQLFLKLFNKYGAKLQLSGDATISYKPTLTYGDSVIVEEIGETLIDKTLKDKIVKNNKTLSIGNLSVETSIGESISSILLKHKNKTTETVSLYDSVKPYLKDSSNINILMEKNNNVDEYFKKGNSDIPAVFDYHPNTNVFYWGPRNIQNNMTDWLRYCPKFKVVNTDLLTKYTNNQYPNQAQEIIDSEFVCVWTKVSGPDCRFVDLNKTQTNKNYNIAYSNEVLLVPSSTGKYVLKCVVSGPYGSFTKIKTIFIVDGREKIQSEQEIIDNPNFATYTTDASDNLFNFSSMSFTINNDAPLPGELLPNDEAVAEEIIDNINNNNITTNRVNIQNINLNKYRTENVKIPLNKDQLQVFIAGLDSVAVHRDGLFAPIRTNYYVEKVAANSRPIEKLNENNNYLFMFDKDGSTGIIPKLTNSTLSINYKTNNTIIKLDRIILRNIRNDTVQCSQCYSLYKPKFKSFIGGNKRPNFTRSNKNPDSFTLQKYLPDANIFYPSETREYYYPIISTDISPPIRSYGGYGNKILDKLSINNLESLKKPKRLAENNGLVAQIPEILPYATGYKLDYKDDFVSLDDAVRNYKFCYQQHVMPTEYLKFNKGCFIPESGWVVNDSRNLSSVLKFNPGARQSFSFSGPGILNLSNYTNSAEISSNIFRSTIELEINPIIRWKPEPAVCDQGLPEAVARAKKAANKQQHDWTNQIEKELSDQLSDRYANDYHHGYRILNGGNPKTSERNLLSEGSPTNDEFNFSINEINNRFIYGFNVVGPPGKISFSDDDLQFLNPDPNNQNFNLIEYIENNNGLKLRNPRVNDLTIKDIEVKLNFLNYVNTKNLVIWLEVDFIGKGYLSREKRNISRNKQKPTEKEFAPAQITSSNIFIDQFISNDTYKGFKDVRNDFLVSAGIPVSNTDIKQYLQNLTDSNSVDNIGEKLILHLLNQETVQNKEYNFSVIFSDTANKHNVLFDQNIFSTGIIDPEQYIINNNMKVNASRHSIDYDTYHNSNFSNINKNNNLNINNNTFNKFANKRLFAGVDPEEDKFGNPCPPNRGPYDAATTFTLCIAVLEEQDEMFPMDTIVNNELYTNIASIENSITSANLFNNLCSWELILHTEDVKKPVTSQLNSLANYGGTDALSCLEYGKDPKYPGYSFIADLKDSKFLLPLVNMNAPTTFFQNYNACEYADNELIGKGALINSPRFPTEALIFILAGTAVGGMTGTLVGALVGGLGPTYALGFQMIFDYFKQSRQVPLLELAQRETFDIEYDGYPFGNSDKILLNISKDGLFWYKVEASIFKLNNTPALPLKKYSLIKSDNKLFKFNFNIVSNRSDIIDELFIQYIINKATPEDADETDKALYQNIDDNVYNNFDFMGVDELVFANKIIHSENIFQYLNKPDQTLIIIDHTIPYYLISIGDSITLDCNNLSAIVMSKALIYKDSKYITVLVLNKSKEILNSCSSLLLPEDVVIVCGSENSTLDISQTSPVSLFGLVSDQPPNDTIPDLTFSTNSLGSYGDGSSVKDKNILSRKVQINHIESIYNQLNNFNNDKYYYNELAITLPSGQHKQPMAPTGLPTGVPIVINNKLESYPVYYDVSNNNIVNSNIYHIIDHTFSDSNATDNREAIRDLLDNINTSIKNNKTYFKDHRYNMIYLKVKDNNSIKQLYRNAIASVTIENIYSYKDTVTRITIDELKTLTDRLAVINQDNIVNLDSLIGEGLNTNTILASDSIFYIQQHYDSLSEDLGDCSRVFPVLTCYKYNTYNKLQKLYSEKNDILKLLDKQTIKKVKIYKSNQDFTNNVFIEGIVEFNNIESIKLIDNSIIFQKEEIFKIVYEYILDPEAQKYHTDNGGIIPDQKVNIVTNADKSLNITYENLSNNYYWINIDPKQSISIAEEMRPKILKSVKYVCQNTNPSFTTGGSQLISFNNVCPDWSVVDTLENDKMIIKADSTGTTYTFKEDFINEQKESFGARVLSWKNQTIERRFRINSEKSTNNSTGENQEFLVTAIETYDIALDTIEIYIKNGREAGLSDSDIVSTMLEENILKNDYSGDILKNGLLDGLENNSRNAFPTRVYNIFNLDDTQTLKVQFRKAPRALRGIDAIGTILRYGENMSYRPQNRPPLDPLDAWGIGRTESLINNLYQWKCYQKDPLAAPQAGGSLLEAKTPEFFQLLNEMIFRAFFGSVDNIENKTPQLRSLYDFEMIPYEYFIKPTGIFDNPTTTPPTDDLTPIF